MGVPGTLLVVALGDVKRSWLEAAAGAPAAILGLTPKGGPALSQPKYAFNPERNQHHGAGIFRKMLQAAPAPANGVVLGLGDLDLFAPESNYVLGDHDRDLRACVIGLRRLLDPHHEERSRKRIGAAAAWAVGRALGLSDCDDRRCALAFPETPEILDARSGMLCASCQSQLGQQSLRA